MKNSSNTKDYLYDIVWPSDFFGCEYSTFCKKYFEKMEYFVANSVFEKCFLPKRNEVLFQKLPTIIAT